MLNVTKRINGYNYYTIAIETIEGIFEILFAANLDLYWRFIPDVNVSDAKPKYTVKITKENYFIFSLFENLYNAIKDNNPFRFIENPCYNDQKIFRMIEHNLLFKDGVISWHSDDYGYEEAPVVEIYPISSSVFGVTFTTGRDCEGWNKSYSVRFRNSGSRYDPFNLQFMLMYQELKKYNPDCHQIHMEEVLYMQNKEW